MFAMGPEIDLLHLFVGYLNTSLIESRVQLGLDPEAGRGAGGANEVDHRLIAHQRLALPVQTDEREHAVLDLVPFAGARRIVTHRDGQAGLIRELLQVIFPCPIPATITSPAIGAQQQSRRRGIAPATDPSPPPADALDRELGGVMADTDVDEAFVPLLVISPVRNRRPDTQ